MSLCRYSKNSDIYVYVTDIDQYGRAAKWYCCFPVDTPEEMIKHIKEHIDAGDVVPETVIPDIESRDIG